MTRHLLAGCAEHEVTWYRRRGFVRAAAAWLAMGGYSVAQAQARSNIVTLVGDARVNGQPLLPQQSIQTTDQIETGPGSTLIFVIGDSAFHLRQNSHLKIESGATSSIVGGFRLLTGAIVSVWGKGTPRQIATPTLTAGIRGTGTYTEVPPDQGGRTYFCNCYGIVDLANGPQRQHSEAEYHDGVWAEVSPQQGRYLTPAKQINHTDEEVEQLALLANQRTAWQISGRKDKKDGYDH